jgi:hypothetical protein
MVLINSWHAAQVLLQLLISLAHAGVYIVMVIRASSKNPMTGKSIKDHRVCNIHHMVEGRLARMEDFAGELRLAPASTAKGCLMLSIAMLLSASHLPVDVWSCVSCPGACHYDPCLAAA